ncbi:hypothetical protein AC578_8286 [Pseudocercospora eumusae]|uniref:Uncharacterized protein n=1 Tax=Pseudocercospora eumusae TaxID=321146 RepID=A0A139GYU7_9PEZI|nr:hypothetical protein AC578_8286 [Pseudocercospora eumusae]
MMPGTLHLAAFSACMGVACGLGLPQGTTGPSGGFSPYAQNTNITYYNGLSAAAGGQVGAVDDCGKPVGADVIKSLYCTPLKHSGIGIAQTVNGSCTFTLFSESDSCSGYHRHVISIPNGDESTCIATGVRDGGKGSGVWACG